MLQCSLRYILSELEARLILPRFLSNIQLISENVCQYLCSDIKRIETLWYIVVVCILIKFYNALKYKSKTMNTEKPIKEVILYRGESVACINQCK